MFQSDNLCQDSGVYCIVPGKTTAQALGGKRIMMYSYKSICDIYTEYSEDTTNIPFWFSEKVITSASHLQQ